MQRFLIQAFICKKKVLETIIRVQVLYINSGFPSPEADSWPLAETRGHCLLLVESTKYIVANEAL